jgi:hypothetical protein
VQRQLDEERAQNMEVEIRALSRKYNEIRRE